MGQQGQVRYTPDELKAAQAAGLLTPEIISTMHPQDQKLAQSLSADSTKSYPAQVMDRFTGSVKRAVTERPIESALTVAGPAAVGIGAELGLPALASKVIPYGKMAGQGLAWGAGMAGASELAKKLGIPTSIADILVMSLAMGHGGKGMPSGAMAGEGAAMSEAEAIAAKEAAAKIKPSNVSHGRTLDPLQADPGGDIYNRVVNGGGNTTIRRQPPSSDPVGVGDNVHRGVTNSWNADTWGEFGHKPAPSPIKPSRRAPQGPSTAGPASDKMPTGSNGDYQGWSDAQDQKFPPSDTSIEDLLKRLRASLDKRK